MRQFYIAIIIFVTIPILYFYINSNIFYIHSDELTTFNENEKTIVDKQFSFRDIEKWTQAEINQFMKRREKIYKERRNHIQSQCVKKSVIRKLLIRAK